MNLTTHHQLFGPVEQAAQVEQIGNQWTWLSPAASANQKEFFFGSPHPPILWATWTLICFPKSTAQKARLVEHHYPNPVMTEFARIEFPSITGGPMNVGVVITDQLNAFRTAGNGVYLTHEFIGDGAPWTLYESRLSILWNLG